MGNRNLENVSHEEAVATLKATSDHVKLVVAKPVYDDEEEDDRLPPPPPPPIHADIIQKPTPPRE